MKNNIPYKCYPKKYKVMIKEIKANKGQKTKIVKKYIDEVMPLNNYLQFQNNGLWWMKASKVLPHDVRIKATYHFKQRCEERLGTTKLGVEFYKKLSIARSSSIDKTKGRRLSSIKWEGDMYNVMWNLSGKTMVLITIYKQFTTINAKEHLLEIWRKEEEDEDIANPCGKRSKTT